MSADREALEEAMWAGDVDKLHELAPCECCCHEHTFLYCPAREWGGCRSGLAPGETDPWDEPGWQEHYAKHHGMSWEMFYGYDTNDTNKET